MTTPPDYTLYYWPIPFRGHFIRYVLAEVGAVLHEADTDALIALKSQPVAEQPAPMMAPPMLHEHASGLWLAQLPAILIHLARRHDLMPGDAGLDALTLKLICDCNDVLEEITCSCGRTMWTARDWQDFAATRLPRWMAMFENLGHRHGLSDAAGYMLGTDTPTLADLATSALWFTMIDKLPVLAPLLESHAPAIAALSRRIATRPAIAAMRAKWDAAQGDIYCGGEIEKSLRAVLAGGAAQ